MKKSLRIPLAMPRVIVLLALVVLAAVVGLTGCAPDKHIIEVKALAFSYPSDNVQDPNMTVDQALDYRKICESIKWKIDETEQHQTFVQYTCTYKGVEDSAFIAASRVLHPTYAYAEGASDIYQWVYGADGKPQFQYVALQYHYSDGTIKDMTRSDTMNGMYVDGELWATALMQAAVKNADVDYDHFYSALYGIRIPAKPETVMQAPTATPVTETGQEATIASRPGNTTDSVAAAMASTAMTPPASAPVAAPVAFPAVAPAPTTAAAGTSESGDVGSDGWPKMTPCIEKLQEKFMTDQEKQNADTSTSLEQMQEWADVCKSLGK